MTMIDPLVDSVLIEGLLDLVKAAGEGTLTVTTFAKGLFDLAARTGLAPAILSQYLTESGMRYAETAADIAETAKLAVDRIKNAKPEE